MDMQKLKQLIYEGEKVDVECKQAESSVPRSVYERADRLEFTNPGILKLPIEDIFQGGNSKPRNPRMQTMLRLIGFGDNAGSGFPAILSAWKSEGWITPELKEDTRLNQVTLLLTMAPDWLSVLTKLRERIQENIGDSATQVQNMVKDLESSVGTISIEKVCMEELSKRHKQILNCMQEGKSYSTEEVAQMIGLKGPRTRQLLNELVVMELISCTAATKNRRYVKDAHSYE